MNSLGSTLLQWITNESITTSISFMPRLSAAAGNPGGNYPDPRLAEASALCSVPASNCSFKWSWVSPGLLRVRGTVQERACSGLGERFGRKENTIKWGIAGELQKQGTATNAELWRMLPGLHGTRDAAWATSCHSFLVLEMWGHPSIAAVESCLPADSIRSDMG